MHFADGRSSVFTGLHWDGKQTSLSSLRPKPVRMSIPGWLLRRYALSLRIDPIGCTQAPASLLFSKHFIAIALFVGGLYPFRLGGLVRQTYYVRFISRTTQVMRSSFPRLTRQFRNIDDASQFTHAAP